MLANFFSKSKPVNFIVLFLLFLSYYFVTLFSKNITLFSIGKELFLFIVLFSIYIFIITKNEVTYDNSYAFLFYTTLIGFFINNIAVGSVFYANLTILLFLRKVYSLQSSKNIFHKLFDGGLWLGISFIIEPFTIFFALLLYASTYLHQRFTYQTLLTPVLGFISPVILYFTYCFWYNALENFFLLFSWKAPSDFSLYLENDYLFPIVFIGFFTLFAILLKTPKALAVLNRFRKNWILVLFHLIVSGAVFVLIPNKSGIEFLFLLFPTSVILANGLEIFQKKWFADVFIIVFVIASITVFFL